MSETPSKKSERRPAMHVADEASLHLRALAEPWAVGDSIKAAIRRAGRKAGIEPGLAKRLWYGEARRIDAETMDKLRAAAADAQELEAARNARRSILDRLAACEAALGLPAQNHDRSVADRGR